MMNSFPKNCHAQDTHVGHIALDKEILSCKMFIAVCIYCFVMMSIDLSKKFTSHVQMVTGSADVTVTQLLRYHMLLLYCMQPFN